MKRISPKVFSANDPEFITHLKEKGYVAVKGTSVEKAESYYSELWDWLENLETGIDRDDPETWNQERWPSAVHSIIKSYGIGQADFLWKIRAEPRVRRAFARIWDVDKDDGLICSFDGAGIYPKPVNSRAKWPHRDQSTVNNTFSCVQGAFNLVESDGGLVVWPKSHLIDWTERYEDARACKKTEDWYRIPDNDEDITFENARVLLGPPGTLFLWDSRCIHQNQSGTIGSRAAAYVCMVPRSWATDSILKKRIKYYEKHRTTSHSPHHIKVNPDSKMFRMNNSPDPKIQMTKLTETPGWESIPIIRDLIGY